MWLVVGLLSSPMAPAGANDSEALQIDAALLKYFQDTHLDAGKTIQSEETVTTRSETIG